jgi:hypothetical protein
VGPGPGAGPGGNPSSASIFTTTTTDTNTTRVSGGGKCVTLARQALALEAVELALSAPTVKEKLSEALALEVGILENVSRSGFNEVVRHGQFVCVSYLTQLVSVCRPLRCRTSRYTVLLHM